MKTLKYLVLLMVAALALPAMAQEKEMEKAVFEKAVKGGKIKLTEATEGRLSKNFSYTVSGGENLVVEVYNDKMSLRMVKNGAGEKELTCSAKSAAVCPQGFRFVDQNAVQLAPVFENDKLPFVMQYEDKLPAAQFSDAHVIEFAAK